MIAKIAVSAAVFAIDKPYDYLVPDSMFLQPGMRVTVPFGRGNRVSEGIVLALEEGTPSSGVKSVSSCLDNAPVLDNIMLRVAAFVRQRYYCTFFEAIRAILPAGLWFRAKDTYTVSPDLSENWQVQIRRMEGADAVLQTVLDHGGSVDYTVLRQSFSDETQLQKLLRYLVGKNFLQTETCLLRRTGDKIEKVVTLEVSPEDAMAFAKKKKKSAPLQYAVLELLSCVGSASSKDLCYFTGANSATLRRLQELGYVSFHPQQVLRCPQFAPVEKVPAIDLTTSQQTVYEGLATLLESVHPGTALLYGVTGAGKTSVYLRLIHRCLSLGKSALILVPEIALTPQLLRQFAAHFGDQVAMLHSGLRITERYDQWQRIQKGEAKVVLGTRSAIFAPMQQPGLFILDEEQEHTYKSENTPRYHAREVAIYRGIQQNALVVLGSATPSVESMYYAKTGKYQLFCLPERFQGAVLPKVDLVDMKQELRAGNSSPISRRLRREIQANLDRGEQTILFLNRRGSSRMLLCVDCGFVPQCPNCSVRLTYHSANQRLMCHYCGHSVPLPTVCPVCAGHLKQVGFGTQRLQQELERIFPDVPTLRMDADTVSASNSHEKILDHFGKERIPILIGTQMVTKGLDFENVTLVGVMDADQSLYVDSYRAAETTFSMLTQVVGRAGRGEKRGRAVVQTMTPAHSVLTLAAKQDYNSFFNGELSIRKLQRTPPFGDLVLINFSGPFQEQVLQAAAKFRDRLLPDLLLPGLGVFTPVLLGPAPAAVAKISNRYRYRLTLRCQNTRALRQMVANHLRQFAREKIYPTVHITADSNPYDL